MLLRKYTGILFAAILLAGCSTTKTLYNWEDYQTILYRSSPSAGGTSPEQQINDLQKIIQTSAAKDKAVPPGLHAHLGLLYAKTGRTEQALAEFATEKRLFPEAAQFMDFLLSKDKGSFK